MPWFWIMDSHDWIMDMIVNFKLRMSITELWIPTIESWMFMINHVSIINRFWLSMHPHFWPTIEDYGYSKFSYGYNNFELWTAIIEWWIYMTAVKYLYFNSRISITEWWISRNKWWIWIFIGNHVYPWLFAFGIPSIHIPDWKKMKIMEILTSMMNIMIERWIYTYLSWTIGIRSQVSIIKWWTSILNDGYPVYGIRNRAYARLFAVGFPCIHISDWQIKIMDIIDSIINIRIFVITDICYWICRGLFFI